MSQPPDNYVHGHGEAVLRSHTSRTAANSAAYLLPHLAPGHRVLDVGCGPGTITYDLARLVRPGDVVGLDASSDIVAMAEGGLPDDVVNCRFVVGDVYALDFDDGHFDVVHAHQVLQHLRDPVAALVEMARVTRPGGLVAARDADYAGMTWAPDDPRLDRWMALYQEITSRNGVEANAGRYLLGWAQQAGFSEVEASSSTWTFADPQTREWWGGLWGDRVVESSYAQEVAGPRARRPARARGPPRRISGVGGPAPTASSSAPPGRSSPGSDRYRSKARIWYVFWLIATTSPWASVSSHSHP